MIFYCFDSSFKMNKSASKNDEYNHKDVKYSSNNSKSVTCVASLKGYTRCFRIKPLADSKGKVEC